MSYNMYRKSAGCAPFFSLLTIECRRIYAFFSSGLWVLCVAGTIGGMGMLCLAWFILWEKVAFPEGRKEVKEGREMVQFG